MCSGDDWYVPPAIQLTSVVSVDRFLPPPPLRWQMFWPRGGEVLQGLVDSGQDWFHSVSPVGTIPMVGFRISMGRSRRLYSSE